MLSPLATLLMAAPAAPVLPLPQDELLTVWIAEGTQLLSHSKDRALARALAMIDDRILELPGEFPEAQFPPQMVPFLVGLLTDSKTFRISTDESGGPVPVRAQFDWNQHTPEEAQQLASGLMAFLTGMGAPIPEADEAGWTLLPLPLPMPLGFGPRGSSMSMSLGAPFPDGGDLSTPDLPEGVTPHLLMRVDVGAMVDMGLEALPMFDPKAAEVAETVVSMLGLDELSISAACGADEHRGYSVARLPGFGAAMQSRGLMSEKGLSAASLRMVPVDAHFANIGQVNLQGILDLLLAIVDEPLTANGVEDPIEMLAEMTGVHLENDLIAHLGQTIGMYTSDTTGGGGIASTVLFMEVTNSAGLRGLIEQLIGLANGIAMAEAEGYVQVRPWGHNGTQYWSLTFPGIPVPVEPTVVLTDNMLFVCATPGAAVAAVTQAAGNGPSLLDNEGFRAQLPANPEGSYNVVFLDTPRFLSAGYGLVSMGTSALVNGTRSRTDDSRDAGIVMPLYHELAAGALPIVGVDTIEDGDLVSRSHTDASLLVNITGISGYYLSNPAMFLPAALLLAGAGVREQQMATMQAYEIEEASKPVPVEDY
ncbi:MAG: hypothetical protein ACI8QC_002377 [Planctomycetota bacterium]|jgi:hypothetical protein